MMLKRLASLGALTLLCGGIMASQGNKNASPNPQPAKQEQPALLPANGEQSQSHTRNEHGKADNVPPGGHASFKWPQWMNDSNWWLVIIAALTGGMIGYQSWATSQAAKGALLNAEAAVKQARLTEQQMALVFRKERGFLEIKGNGIEVMDGPKRVWNLVGDIQLTNSGNIPLRVFSGAGECLVLKVEDYAPSMQSQRLQKIESTNTWIRPRDGGYREGLWSDEIQQSKTVFARMLANFDIQIVLRGTIDYESHGSAWRRLYAFTWLSDKPKSGDEITKGKWVEDSDAENEEYEIPCPPQVPF